MSSPSPSGKRPHAGSETSGTSSMAPPDKKKQHLLSEDEENYERDEQDEQSPTLYTTAGTIWRPESEQPLQAPIRRGRAQRWSPHQEQGNRVSLLTRQLEMVGIGSPTRGGMPYPADPRAQYSPLRQNDDRARTPIHPAFGVDGSPGPVPDSSPSPLEIMRRSIEIASSAMSPSVSEADMNLRGVPIPRNNDNGYDSVDEALRKLPVKSLANLASYPNPNQLKAQNALSYARIRLAMEGANEPNNPSSNASSRSNDMAVFPNMSQGSGGSKISETDIRALEDYSIRLAQTKMSKQHYQPPLGGYSSSTLATGPGAPAPLKAGPPGQRQYFFPKTDSSASGNMPSLPHSPQNVYPHPGVRNPFHGAIGAGQNIFQGPRNVPTPNSMPAQHGGFGSLMTDANASSAATFGNDVGAAPNFEGHAHNHGYADSPAKQAGQLPQSPSYNLRPYPYSTDIQQGYPMGNVNSQGPAAGAGYGLYGATNAMPMGTTQQALATSHPSGSNRGPNAYNGASGSNLSASALGIPARRGGLRQGLNPNLSEDENWSVEAQVLKPYGWDPSEFNTARYPSGAVKMSDNQLHERQKRVDDWFYSGTARLGMTLDEFQEQQQQKQRKPGRNPFGAVGGGQLLPKGTAAPQLNPGPKKTYKDMSIEEANKMSTAEHAEPLLNVALQSLDYQRQVAEVRKEAADAKAKKEAAHADEEEKVDEKSGSAALLPGSIPSMY